MLFSQSTLMPGETIIANAHPHWKMFVWPGLVSVLGIVMVIVGLVGVIAEPGTMPPWVAFVLVLGLVIGLIGLGFVLLAVLVYRSTEIVLTNKRLLVKVGVIRRQSIEILLSKIEAISLDQPLLGRVLNYGTLIVSGTGGSTNTCPVIGGPIPFRTRIQQEVDRVQTMQAREG